MFRNIFIENDIENNSYTKNIIKRFPQAKLKYLQSINDVWGKVKKPYLQKRTSLDLFIGSKKGELVKVAPDAYGLKGDPHYYFVHAYNCIYECHYCYLQGYFNTPDIVLYVNHQEILDQIVAITQQSAPNSRPWFHAGEYSDSLALSHITGEIPLYFETFKNIPQAYLELRTKSVNIRPLLSIAPVPNVIVSMSMAPAQQINKFDEKTPPLKARLIALKKLAQHGHSIGLHFDPVIYTDNFKDEYRTLIQQIFSTIDIEIVEYLSIGVVRFTKPVYHQVKLNYPRSEILQAEFVKSFDNKIRYQRPHRLWILSTIKQLLIDSGLDQNKIYLCMEND